MTTAALLGRRAIVVGGSIGGMLAARVAAAHFDVVQVLERDEFTTVPQPRRMTPQAHHVHMLLKGGENAIDRLVPGFLAALAAHGSVTLEGRDFAAASELGFAARGDNGMLLHGQSRWLLEHCVREGVTRATPNLEVHTGTTVRGLAYDAAANRVTGVVVDDAAGGTMQADCVIDATGRGEAGLRWLSALGLALPAVEEVKVDFGYSSAVVELDATQPRAWLALALGNLPRVGARGAVLLPIEGGRYLCSLGGRAGDYPPETAAAFLDFAKSLPQSAMYDALVAATFVSPVSRMIYPANRFRHYEQLESLPTGLLPLGDALCSFNPTYGQGMSSAALQAEALGITLTQRAATDSLRDVARAYLQRAAAVARMPWRQANYNDFLYPTTEGDRTMFTDDERNYRMQVAMAAARDEGVRRLSGEVGHLLLPFEALMTPEIRAQVARALAE